MWRSGPACRSKPTTPRDRPRRGEPAGDSGHPTPGQSWRTLIHGLLLPDTDTAVAVEAVAAAAVLAVALVGTWRHGEWRTLTIGVTVFVFAFFALRTVH